MLSAVSGFTKHEAACFAVVPLGSAKASAAFATLYCEYIEPLARAGVDVIAHGVGDRAVDEELVGLMRAKGTTYVSTLAVYEPRGRDILTPLLSAVLEPAVRAQVSPPLTEPPAGGEIVGALLPVPPATGTNG